MTGTPASTPTSEVAMTASEIVRHQVMWNRLISVVEEQALALVRTAFSTSVREQVTSRQVCSMHGGG